MDDITTETPRPRTTVSRGYFEHLINVAEEEAIDDEYMRQWLKEHSHARPIE